MEITFFKPARFTLVAVLMLQLFACGGGSSKDSYQEGTHQYRISVTINDLSGGNLILQNNDRDTLEITQDGSFTFATQLYDNDSYHVTIINQPPSQSCSISNDSGVIAGANVNNITVTCHTAGYIIGGFVTGLTGSGLVLLNNGGEDLNITTNGEFSFPTRLESGQDYRVTIATQPSGQSCNVADGSGTLNDAELPYVVISCPLHAVTPKVTGINPKILRFSWNDVGADYYRLLKNPDGQTGYTQVGADITDTQLEEVVSVHLTDWANASYLIQACNGADLCSDSSPLSINSSMIYAIGYLKASDIERSSFGTELALSKDGTTLAASSTIGIHVFINEGTGWRQQTVINEPFSTIPSLSADGNTLALGVYRDTSIDITGGGGYVRIFTRNGDSWSQQATINSSNSEFGDYFGYAVALSDDGDTLAASAYGEDSAATGVDGTQTDNSAPESGAAYLFKREDNSWRQQAYIKPSNTDAEDQFGESIALSADGSILVVGATGERSNATGINGNQSDNSARYAGAVYLFTQNEGKWTQQAYIKASNTEERDFFGTRLALSGRGDILAVSATHEASSATGINGDQTDNTAERSGAVYLFESQINNTWAQTTYIKASNTDPSDMFGEALALSDDGTMLAAGAWLEKSIARGINGDQSDNSATRAGAVYLFSGNNGSWHQQAYVKASNTRSDRSCPVYDSTNCPPKNAAFGASLALSANGGILAVSAPAEYSPDPAHEPYDAPPQYGAVYLY